MGSDRQRELALLILASEGITPRWISASTLPPCCWRASSMHPTSPDVSLFHSDCAAACAIGSCGLPNSRSKSFGLCATANEAPIDRSASTPNHLGNAGSPTRTAAAYGTSGKTLFNRSKYQSSQQRRYRPPRCRDNPITGIAGCCPRAARGHATAAPASSDMNERRFTRSPHRRAIGSTPAPSVRAPWRSSD
jgi:hypothetical protein